MPDVPPNKDPATPTAQLGLGDVKDLGEAVGKLGVSQEVVSAIEIVGGIVIMFIPGGILVGISVVALGVLGLFSKTDDLESNVQKLLAEFDILFSQLQGQEDVETMRSVGEKIDNARTALRTLRMFPDDPRLQDPNGAVLFNSSLEVETLGDISFYIRPFLPSASYSNPWGGRIDPPAFPHATGSALVFDYRLTLPAFLEAIAIRLTILSVLVPTFRESDRAEVRDNMANRLEDLYARIRDGIVLLPKPTVADTISTRVFDANNGALLRIDASPWDKVGRPYGAVERYSTISVVDGYHADRFVPDVQNIFFVASETVFGERDNPNPPALPESRLPSNEDMVPFFLEYAIGALARAKAVYNVLGLPKLKAVVNALKEIAGEPRLEKRPDGDWSMRELDSTVATIVFNKPSTADNPSAPIRIREVFSLIQNTLRIAAENVSLRRILDKVALQN